MLVGDLAKLFQNALKISHQIGTALRKKSMHLLVEISAQHFHDPNRFQSQSNCSGQTGCEKQRVRRLTEKSEKFKQLSEERRSVSLLSFS
jgi:hypothetical protein